MNIAWLEQKKAEYASCTCLTQILKGNWDNMTVYELRTVDPLCNGLNMVYKEDGTVLLHSGDQPAYQNYLNSVSGLKVIWSCAEGQK